MQKREISKNVLGLVFLCLPIYSHATEIRKVDFAEYSHKATALNSACGSKGMPSFSGFCLSQEYGKVSLDNPAQTSITIGLEIASFEYFYSRCEHSDFSSASDTLVKAKKVLDATKYFEEIKIQKEALENYVGRFYACKTKIENDATVLNKLKWFEYMSGKYSAGPVGSNSSASNIISSVWRVTQLSCNGFVAHQLQQSPDAAEIIRTSVVQIPQVQLQFAIPRTANVPAKTVRLVFDDRARKVVDHYILLSRNDLDDPVAAVMVTELPPSFDTPQKALAAAVTGERGNVEGSGAQATFERISTPWGEGLDIFVPNRAGSPCFPSARYRLSSPPDAGPTIGLSRFITMPGRLIQFALVLNAPHGMSAEEQKSHARQVMDVFAAGLRKL